jgi:large subunit ribosomal protein L10
MNREQKIHWVDDVRSSTEGSEIMLVTHYKGLNVAQISALRNKVRAAGASFKVTKNSLMKRAIAGTHYEPLSKHFAGPTAIAYATDPVAIAKVITDFSKENEKLVILAGVFGDTIMDEKYIAELAKLPSLDELRAKIISLIKTPATRIAGVTRAPAGQLARVFGAYGASE